MLIFSAAFRRQPTAPAPDESWGPGGSTVPWAANNPPGNCWMKPYPIAPSTWTPTTCIRYGSTPQPWRNWELMTTPPTLSAAASAETR